MNRRESDDPRWWGRESELDESIALAAQMDSALHDDRHDAAALIDDALARAERISMPMPAVLSRLLKISNALDTSRCREAISQYTTVLGIIARKGELLPGNVISTVYALAPIVFDALLMIPEASLEQIHRFVRLIDDDVRLRGQSPTIVAVLNTAIAAEIGDRPAFDHWFEEWRIGRPLFEDDPATERYLQALNIRAFDEAAALRIIDQRVDRPFDDDEVIRLESLAVECLARLGEREYALRRTIQLFDAFGERSVLEHANCDSLLRALEPRPDLTGPTYARLREELGSTPADGIEPLDALASVARYLWLRDADAPEGHEFARRARALAAAYDRRNGTGFQTFRIEHGGLEGHGLPPRR